MATLSRWAFGPDLGQIWNWGMITLRYSGGRFTQIEPGVRQMVEDNAPAISATGPSAQALADAVERALMGEPDRAPLCEPLCLSITFRS